MLDHFFSLLFPKDSESLKILDIQLREVGAKIPLNGTSKVNRQTDKQTHRRSFRLLESIGPEGRCFENDESKGGGGLAKVDMAVKGGRGVEEILTMADKGGGGVMEMQTMADKGGRRGLHPHFWLT